MGQREYDSLVEGEEDVNLADVLDMLQAIDEANAEASQPHPYDCHCVECVLDAAIEERIDYA